MEEYNRALRILIGGNKLLALAIWHSIKRHPALTCLILSSVLNIILLSALMQTSYKYNTAEYNIIQLEQQNDSLRGANIRYTSHNATKL